MNKTEVVPLKRAKVKRITVYVPTEIDRIRDRLQDDTGVKMSYVQVFRFLIHFYMQRANEPKTRWAALK